jgi:hypothetical protein
MAAIGRLSKRVWWGAGSLAAVIVAAACGPAIAADDSRLPMGSNLLVHKFETGQKVQHMLSMETGQFPNVRKTKTWIFSTVLSKNEDGSAVILKKLSNYQMKVELERKDAARAGLSPGMFIETANETGVTITQADRVNFERGIGAISDSLHEFLFVEGARVVVQPTGETSTPVGILALPQNERAAVDALIGTALGIVFPKVPLSVGGSWTYEQRINSAAESVVLASKCTLTSIDAVKGKRYARIECERSGEAKRDASKPTEPHKTIKVNCRISFDIDGGFVQEADFKIVEREEKAGGGQSTSNEVRGTLEKKWF